MCSFRPSVLACLALLAACWPEADPSPRALDSLYPTAKPNYSSASDLLQHDFGTGILFLAESPGGRGLRSDTVAIHGSPDPASEVKALFVFDQSDPNSWSYQIWNREQDLVSNMLEFAYEESGLPLDSLHPRGWARAIYARDSLGESQKGWVELRSGPLAHMLWTDHLPERGLYLLSPETREFFSEPQGEPLAISPGDAYELIPTRVQGNWMQVRVVTPSICGAAPGKEVRERIAWIRYWQPDGRPRVWYYARGC